MAQPFKRFHLAKKEKERIPNKSFLQMSASSMKTFFFKSELILLANLMRRRTKALFVNPYQQYL